jgi:hypothetical protein
MITLRDGDGPGHGMIYCILTRDTVCTASSIHFSATSGIRISQIAQSSASGVMLSPGQSVVQKHVFVVSATFHTIITTRFAACTDSAPPVVEEVGRVVYRIETIADENVSAMTKLAI